MAAPARSAAPPGPQGAGDPLCILIHVPKCAGTTARTHLETHLGETGFWRPERRARALPSELMGRKYDARLPGPVDAVRAISGHQIGQSIERLFPGRAIWRGVVLREPAALLLSWYNYRMMRYAKQGKGTYGLDLHLASLPPDPVAHFLLERWCELPWWRLAAMGAGQKRDRLDAVLGGLDAVVDIADADRLIADISARLGIPGVAERDNTSEGWRARVAWTPLTPAGLTRDQRAAIDARTRLDRYLWQRWALGEADARLDPAGTPSFLASELRRPLAEIRRRRARG